MIDTFLLHSLPILIHNVPSVGAKSRVETQIKMTLDLILPSYPVPSAYDRIGSWKWLKLPKGTSTRRRPRKEAKPGMYILLYERSLLNGTFSPLPDLHPVPAT